MDVTITVMCPLLKIYFSIAAVLILFAFKLNFCDCANTVNSGFCNVMSAACGVKIRAESLSRAKWKGTQPLISTRVCAPASET